MILFGIKFIYRVTSIRYSNCDISFKVLMPFVQVEKLWLILDFHRGGTHTDSPFSGIA